MFIYSLKKLIPYVVKSPRLIGAVGVLCTQIRPKLDFTRSGELMITKLTCKEEDPTTYKPTYYLIIIQCGTFGVQRSTTLCNQHPW